jgi:biopolymer transport protein ExbD
MLYLKEDIHSENQINILPMIDIIFAILSFLIVSSLYLSRVDTIPVDLPKASSSVIQDKKFITISIDKLGNLFLNKKKILLEDLKISIFSLINYDSKVVVLNADKNVSHGIVIKVLDSLRSIEGLKIAISTKSIE